VKKIVSNLAAKCSACGYTLVDLQKVGRLGCSQCYQAFKPVLLEMIPTMHKQLKHVGKAPKGIFDKINLEAALQNMKKDLEIAVDAEDYHEAAILRDTIQEMENSLSKY